MPITSDVDTGLPVVPLWIGGTATTSSPPIIFPVYSAIKQKQVFLAHASDSATATRAVDAAAAAFKTWRKTSAATRRDILLRAADIMESRKAELVSLQIKETSCGQPWALFNVESTVDIVREIASRVTSICAGEMPSTANEGTLSLVFREPIGPVLLIAPWNASIILATRGLTSMIAAGCSIVFKASELCPRTHHAITEVFTQAGVPAGVLNVIQARREEAPKVTETLIAHPAIRKVEFIGSAAVGRIIGSLAGKYLKPVLMELGGKCSAIVLDDADLEDAADKCAMGAFMHHGQICFSTERIIVIKSVASKFIDLLKQKAKKYDPGYGATETLVQKAYEKLKEAEVKGATFIFGKPGYAAHCSLHPVLLTGLTKDMSIWDEETFGPSASVHIVESDEEAIALANDTQYGLNAALHTSNMHRAITIACQLEVGQVHVNALTEHDEPTFPLGATKGSGWGRNNAQYGIEEFLSPKVVSLNMEHGKLAFEVN